MELEAAKVIGAGLAVIGVIGSGIGIGTIFSRLKFYFDSFRLFKVYYH